jgi:signal transduction histidine kinase
MQDMTQGLALACSLQEEGTPWLLSPALDWCAYKFVQEALANVMKHSGATRFEVTVTWTARALDLRARDNGRGVTGPLTSGLGLTSMAERAAELRGAFGVEPQPGSGFLLSLQLPRTTAAGLP